MTLKASPKIARRATDFLIVIALVSIISSISHLYIADRKRFFQIIFPAEAFLSRLTASCSSNAPGWMRDALQRTTSFSIAGQLAYISPDGASHQCIMGWQGSTLLSEPLTQNSYFRLASLTKVVTSLTYASLERAGQVSGNERVIHYFPSEKPLADARVENMRIEDLHRHVAGFDRHITPDPMFRMKNRSWCPSNIEKIYDLHLDFSPGERPSYSNLGYCLLGKIIENVYGSGYRQAVREALNLANYDLDFFDGPFLAREVEYDFRNTGFYNQNYYRYFNFKDASAAIGLVGTAESFARLVFDHKTLLEPLFSLDLNALSCRPSELRACYYYSMQPMRKGQSELLAFSHSGNIWGSSSFMLLDEYGGVLTWAGKGSQRGGSGDFDALKWHFYDMLATHYAGSPP